RKSRFRDFCFERAGIPHIEISETEGNSIDGIYHNLVELAVTPVHQALQQNRLTQMQTALQALKTRLTTMEAKFQAQKNQVQTQLAQVEKAQQLILAQHSRLVSLKKQATSLKDETLLAKFHQQE